MIMRAKFIHESKGAFEPKDLKRIKDFSKKSGGDFNKEIFLAKRMAKTLTNMNKAIGRAFAAYEVYGKWNEIVNLFYDKAVKLGYDGPKPGEFEEEIVLGSQLPKEKRFKRSKRNISGKSSYGGTPILPIGKVDLISGESKYFNVYENWYDSIVEVWRDNKGISVPEDDYDNNEEEETRASSVSNISKFLQPKSKEEIDRAKRKFFNYKLIFTSGKQPTNQIGDKRNFYHDQNGNNIGYWEMVDYVPLKHMRELILPYGRKLNGYVYK